MKNSIVIGLVIGGIVIGGALGFIKAKRSYDVGISKVKVTEMQAMMNDGGKNMMKMADMMIKNGMTMQETGMMMKDEKLVNTGKDMVIFGEKYQKEGMMHESMKAGDTMMGDSMMK